MKAIPVFAGAALMLLAVACRNEEVSTAPAAVAGRTSAKAPSPLLDSFQRHGTATLPYTAKATPGKNRLLIRRDKDSLTVSGVVFAQDERKGRAAWRFYFRASGDQCYAYVKEDFVRADGRMNKLSTSEAGYCLHFFRGAA